MENKTFNYLGLDFEPIRCFTTKERKNICKSGVLNFCSWVQCKEYTHKDFYKKAHEIGAKTFDIFKIKNGILSNLYVVPGTNTLAIIEDINIIENEALYKINIIDSCASLYKELYNSEVSYFRTTEKVQIYWNNKNGYEFEVLVDFTNKNIIFKADNIVFDTKRFDTFFDMREWLTDRNLDYFSEKYSDNYITNQMVFGILNEDITLTDLDEEKQYTYTYFLYKYILYKIYGDKGTVNYKMKDLFDEEFPLVENRTNKKFLQEIRDDILNEIRKEINYSLFEDIDFKEE
ncbi:hypothetical protein [uncultured Fusobacterium sp.]|uniref:hypothetical protein n=1 Tax=uncultured Fusobacterium sp. TaxID=159267 RepID=UPI0015A64EC0|nr:hypothetical protein [uncultured Fusobacterium sp.]